MGVACEVYTKLLFKRGHGHPLWEPEPTQSGEVLIGDVGYMLDGGFYRLFNATLPADHPLHERHGVPDSFEPLSFPDTLRHHRPHALESGPICSKSVTAVSADASVEPGTGSFGPLAHVRFKFSDEQGAVLVLKNDAHREVLHPCRDLTQYILLNHAGWHQFARNVCRLDLKSQDIIFVCGWVKTAEWALAAATHRARDGEIAFGGDFGPAGQASFSVSATHEISMSWEHRRGPKNTQNDGAKPSKSDQCVFLHYYKVKHRPFFVPKVLRAATEEEHSSRSSTPNGSDYMESVDDDGAVSKDSSFESQIEVVPRPSAQGDMVDTMLDYILDQTDATCAIVSDRDIAMLSSQQGQRDIPENLSQLLADTRPNLTVTGGVGMMSCHNAPVDGATLGLNITPAFPPVVQFVAGPPRVLPHYRAWSVSRTRLSRSRSRSAPRALTPSSALVKPSSPLSQLRQQPSVPPAFKYKPNPPGPSLDWSQISIGPARRIPPWTPSSSVLVTTSPDATDPSPRQNDVDEWLTNSLPSSLSHLTGHPSPLGAVLTGEDDDLFALEEDGYGWEPQQLEGSPSGIGLHDAPACGPRAVSETETEWEEVAERRPSVGIAPANLSPLGSYKLPRSTEERILALLSPPSSKEEEKRKKPAGRGKKPAAKKTGASRGRKETARKGKEKEKGMTQKRTRSPEEEALDGEEEDERPAKRPRRQVQQRA